MDRIVSLSEVAIGFSEDPAATPILQDVSLDIHRGEFVVVFGVSGVGKSSLLRVVCGLLQPLRGTVAVQFENAPGNAEATTDGGAGINGTIARNGSAGASGNAGGVSGAGRPFGFVFQEPRLFPWRRVRANVALGLEELDLSREEREERVEQALRLVDLSQYGDRFPRQLSGGQRQRVGIARAIAVRPALLLMDEPFSSLDAVTRRTLQHELLGIWKNTDASVLFVTHDIEEAVFLADRIVLLSGSPARVVEEYEVREQRPRTIDDAGFQAIVRRLRNDLQSYLGGPDM